MDFKHKRSSARNFKAKGLQPEGMALKDEPGRYSGKFRIPEKARALGQHSQQC